MNILCPNWQQIFKSLELKYHFFGLIADTTDIIALNWLGLDEKVSWENLRLILCQNFQFISI